MVEFLIPPLFGLLVDEELRVLICNWMASLPLFATKPERHLQIFTFSPLSSELRILSSELRALSSELWALSSGL